MCRRAGSLLARRHTEHRLGRKALVGLFERRVCERSVDPLNFEPAEAPVKVCDTVSLRVANATSHPHDFTLGDLSANDNHTHGVHTAIRHTRQTNSR